MGASASEVGKFAKILLALLRGKARTEPERMGNPIVIVRSPTNEEVEHGNVPSLATPACIKG